MVKIEKPNMMDSEEDLGLLLWQLQEIENFYPCFRSMIKKE